MLKAFIYRQVNLDDYKLFKNRAVRIGKPEPWKVSEKYNSSNLSNEYLTYLKITKTVAYLVVKDNQLLSETYWGGYNKDSYSNSFSMAKSIISLLVGCAIDDGCIKSMDQPICDFIPEYKEGDKTKITIRNLLTMSSGLRWEESVRYSNLAINDSAMVSEQFIGGDDRNASQAPKIIIPEYRESGKSNFGLLLSVCTQGYYGKNLKRLVLNLQTLDEPGKYFDYRSGNTQLLAMVLETATGKKVSDYASEKIWTKIGAEHDALWSLDRKGGAEKAFCCFNSNARDFAKIGQLMLNGGKWNGGKVIPQWYVNEASLPVKELIDIELNKPNQRYGLHWWCIERNSYHILYARGTLGQYIFIAPELNAVFVRLGHYRNEVYIDGHPEDVYKFIDCGIDIIKRSSI